MQLARPKYLRSKIITHQLVPEHRGQPGSILRSSNRCRRFFTWVIFPMRVRVFRNILPTPKRIFNDCEHFFNTIVTVTITQTLLVKIQELNNQRSIKQRLRQHLLLYIAEHGVFYSYKKKSTLVKATKISNLSKGTSSAWGLQIAPSMPIVLIIKDLLVFCTAIQLWNQRKQKLWKCTTIFLFRWSAYVFGGANKTSYGMYTKKGY